LWCVLLIYGAKVQKIIGNHRHNFAILCHNTRKERILFYEV